MRRTDGDAAVGRAGGRFRRAAMMMALGLATMSPGVAAGGPPDGPFGGGDAATLAGFSLDLVAGVRTGGYYFYVLRGSYLDEQKEYDKAIAAFNQAIQLDPRNAETFLDRGTRLEGEERAGQGVRRLR